MSNAPAIDPRRRPLLSIRRAAEATGLTVPTITTVLTRLQEATIIEETTGRRRDRLFVYRRYLDLLDEGIEAPAP